jgi:hypothetical protein
MRDAILPWFVILLLCGLLLPAAVDLTDDQRSTVTVTFVQPATAADADERP